MEVQAGTSSLSEERRLISLLKKLHSGSTYVVFALEKSLNKSAMMWSVCLLLTENHMYCQKMWSIDAFSSVCCT